MHKSLFQLHKLFNIIINIIYLLYFGFTIFFIYCYTYYERICMYLVIVTHTITHHYNDEIIVYVSISYLYYVTRNFNMTHQDHHTESWLLFLISGRWLTQRLDMLCGVYVSVTCFTCVYYSHG